ncbi:MAG: hypothetical protein IKI64_04825 [Clostridia bacterium]|nr:hypothetical protein [Clostridia bacterium]
MNIDALTEEFKTKLEEFFIGCDALEELELWNKDEHGEMDVFYESDLAGIIIRLIAADGRISEKEVEYLNRNFDLDYTVEELSGVYESCGEELSRSFDERFENGITLMRSVNEKLADAYKELLELILQIIIESDDETTPEEALEEAKVLKSLL